MQVVKRLLVFDHPAQPVHAAGTLPTDVFTLGLDVLQLLVQHPCLSVLPDGGQDVHSLAEGVGFLLHVLGIEGLRPCRVMIDFKNNSSTMQYIY